MKRILKSFLVVLVVSLFFISSAYARPSFNPKGWFKGKKKGWNGEQTPPGLSGKELKEQEKDAKKQAKEAEKAAKKQAEEAEHAAKKAEKEAAEAAEHTR